MGIEAIHSEGRVQKILRSKTLCKANLPHKTNENRHGLGVVFRFPVSIVVYGPSPASDSVTVIFS